MRDFILIFSLFFINFSCLFAAENDLMCNCDSCSQQSCALTDSITDDSVGSVDRDILINDSTIFVDNIKPSLFLAIGQGVMVNTLVWSVDKWILKRPYCSTGWNTFKDNIKRGFVWDCDALSTNFFDHPYHGAQYYNAARVNGFNYFKSSALALLGSLQWEELAETDYPAPNDLFATSIGGTAVGEVMFRISNIILNNKKQRVSRWGRELLNTVVNPIYGVNRLIRGEAWKIDENAYLYHDKMAIPYNMFLSLGLRCADTKYENSRSNVSMHFKIDYGNWTDLRYNKPFDQFTMSLTLNPPAFHIPFFSEFNINARLHGWNLYESEKRKIILSLNQDFTYFNNEKEERFKGDTRHLLYLAEPSSFGPAVYYQSSCFKGVISSNIALMGAYTSDYYYRKYNMGSGFNFKSYLDLNILKTAKLVLDAGFHYLFTWKGYEKDQIKRFQNQGIEPPYNFVFNQSRKAGDQGYAIYFIIKPRLDFRIFNNFYLSAMAQFVFRNSIYKYHENVNSRYNEFMLSMSYRIF